MNPTLRRAHFWFFCSVGGVALGAVGVSLAMAILYPRTPLPVVDARVPRLIDGASVPLGRERTRTVGVLIDGMVDGRPTVGLASAPLVWEVPVEGGITRFLAVYPFDALPEKIGPIRSLRPYVLDFASEVDALLMHVGGSPEALTRARAFPLERLDQFFDDRFFWRATDRRAPHNVFTSQYLVSSALMERQYARESVFASWRYRDERTEGLHADGDGVRPVTSGCIEREGTQCTSSACEQGCNGVRIAYSTPPYTVEWRWNGTRNVYERFMGGVRHEDEDGAAIDAKNVLVQFTSVEILDAIGRRRITTEGEGRAFILTNGKVYEGRWRKGAGERTRFFHTSKQGFEVALTPGTTWIAVAPERADVTVIPSSAILNTSQ